MSLTCHIPVMWDYRFSMAEDSDTNFHLVCCVFYPGFDEIVLGDFSRETLSLRETPKTRFCNFVYGLEHLNSSLRVPFFEKLSGYKRVDSSGKACNNMSPFDDFRDKEPQQWEEQKLDFLQHYKFTIAFENCSLPNYVSEKLLHPLLAGSVPIYWGSPRAVKYFNPDSFINCHDFEDLDAVVEYVKRVDQDEALYRKYREAPAILPDSLCHRMTKKLVAGKLREVLERAQRRPFKRVSRRFINRFVYLPLRSVKLRAASRLRVAKPAVQRKLTGSL